MGSNNMKVTKRDMTKLCECGCGSIIKAYGSNYLPMRFVKGHQKGRLGKYLSELSKNKISFMNKGRSAWNKGTSNLWCKGNKHYNWKGENVGYSAVHSWIRRKYGNANKCQECNSVVYVQWANLDY